jgi:hypothetical protein
MEKFLMWDMSVVVMLTMIPHTREKQREENLSGESRKEKPRRPARRRGFYKSMEQKLLDGVHELLDARLTLGSLILVDDALGSGLVEQATSLVGLSLSELGVLSLNGSANALDSRLELRADGLVAHTSLLGGDDALLLRLDVSHVQILSISSM